MNQLRLTTKFLLITGLFSILFLTLFTNPVAAQVNYTTKDVTLKVSGSSNVHNWDLQSTTAAVTANITLNRAGSITTISSLTFTTPVIALKSEHNGMDKNTYKALKKDANPTISFVSKTATITENTIKCYGTLTIAGKGVETELVVTYKVNSDKTITVTGTKNINMVEYGVEPPTALFGTIKTGKEVVLSFAITLK